jgi:hypothetical protein
MISTGSVTPVTAWVELADGSRRPDPNGRQDVDDQGRPLWRVEVVMPADETDERDRTGVLEVTVAAKDQPDAGSFGEPLVFERLVMAMPYVARKTGQMSAPRFTAEGIRRQSGKGQQAA